MRKIINNIEQYSSSARRASTRRMWMRMLASVRTASLVLFLSMGLLRPAPTSAQDLSSIPGAFAEIGVGASAAALGFSGTSSQRGASALGWNPAAIYSDDGWEMTFSYIDQLETIEYSHAALSIPLRKNRSALAFAVQYSGDDALTEETLRMAYAHRLKFFWLGVGASLHRATFGKNKLSAGDFVVFEPDEIAEGLSQQVRGSALGYAVEAGLRMNWSADLTWALAVRNISAPVKWRSTSDARPGRKTVTESIPLELSTGVNYHFSERISSTLEWVPPLADDAVARVGLGASYQPVSALAIRAGRLIIQDGFENEVITFGFGIKTPASMGVRLHADYAFVTSDIARTQQITLKLGL